MRAWTARPIDPARLSTSTTCASSPRPSAERRVARGGHGRGDERVAGLVGVVAVRGEQAGRVTAWGGLLERGVHVDADVAGTVGGVADDRVGLARQLVAVLDEGVAVLLLGDL